MRPDSKGRRDIGLLIAVLIGLAASPSAAQAQATAATDDPVAKLSGLETTPDIDVAALRQTVSERVKSKADNIALKRPPVAAQLLKLPRLAVDIQFDQDTAIIRPESYRALGRIADTLLNPALLPYRFLIVGHTESGGRRDHNLIVSQRRADAIRDVLVTTFKISPKRLQTLGLGEEQLRDAARPPSATNRRIQVVSLGKMPEPSESPAPPPAKKPPPPGKKPHSRK